jgi:hypothetical protein
MPDSGFVNHLHSSVSLGARLSLCVHSCRNSFQSTRQWALRMSAVTGSSFGARGREQLQVGLVRPLRPCLTRRGSPTRPCRPANEEEQSRLSSSGRNSLPVCTGNGCRRAPEWPLRRALGAFLEPSRSSTSLSRSARGSGRARYADRQLDSLIPHQGTDVVLASRREVATPQPTAQAWPNRRAGRGVR